MTREGGKDEENEGENDSDDNDNNDSDDSNDDGDDNTDSDDQDSSTSSDEQGKESLDACSSDNDEKAGKRMFFRQRVAGTGWLLAVGRIISRQRVAEAGEKRGCEEMETDEMEVEEDGEGKRMRFSQ